MTQPRVYQGELPLEYNSPFRELGLPDFDLVKRTRDRSGYHLLVQHAAEGSKEGRIKHVLVDP
jgi:hypothetical protein